MATGDGQLLQGLGNLVGTVTGAVQQRNQQAFELDRTDMLTRLNNERDNMLMETQVLMQEYNNTRQQMNQRQELLASQGLMGSVKGLDDTGGIGRLASFAGSTLREKADQLYGTIAQMEERTSMYTQAISDYTRGTQLATGFDPVMLEGMLTSGGAFTNDEAMQLWVQKNPSYQGMDEAEMYEDPMFRGFLDTITNTDNLQRVIKGQADIALGRQQMAESQARVRDMQENTALARERVNMEARRLANDEWRTSTEALAYYQQTKMAIEQQVADEFAAVSTNPLVRQVAEINAMTIPATGGSPDNPSKDVLVNNAIDQYMASDRAVNDNSRILMAAMVSEGFESLLTSGSTELLNELGQELASVYYNPDISEEDLADAIMEAVIFRPVLRVYANQKIKDEKIRGRLTEGQLLNEARKMMQIDAYNAATDRNSREYKQLSKSLASTLSDPSAIIRTQELTAAAMVNNTSAALNSKQMADIKAGFESLGIEEGASADFMEIYYAYMAPMLANYGQPVSDYSKEARIRTSMLMQSDLFGDTAEMRKINVGTNIADKGREYSFVNDAIRFGTHNIVQNPSIIEDMVKNTETLPGTSRNRNAVGGEVMNLIEGGAKSIDYLFKWDPVPAPDQPRSRSTSTNRTLSPWSIK